MKILHVISSLNKNDGGLPEFAKNLAIQQNKNGNIANIITTHDLLKDDNFIKKKLKNFKVYSFERNFFKNINYSGKFKKFIDKNLSKYDLIHIHGLYRFPTTYAAYKAFKKKIPYIISPHGSLDPYLYKQSKKNIILKRIWEFLFEFPLLKRSNAIHSTCKAEQKKILKYNFKSKIFITKLFISDLFFKKKIFKINKEKLDLKKENFNIIFVGRINFKKGLDLLIPAFKKIKKKFFKTKLIIVGPDNENYLKSNLIPLIKKYKLDEDIIYKKPLYNEELINFYKNSNLFVLPSYSENFGLTIFEAMSQKVPVIVSDQIDMVDEIKKNNSAIVCKCNINSLYKSIEIVLKNKKKKKQIIKNAFKFVNRFKSSEVEKEMRLNYKKLLQKKLN